MDSAQAIVFLLSLIVGMLAFGIRVLIRCLDSLDVKISHAHDRITDHMKDFHSVKAPTA